MTLLVIITVFALAILVSYLQSPSVKGKIGEAIVNRAISKKLDKTQYHLVKDVTLPTVDGTTQVEHIIVSRYGIFVIETKKMKGWIFGSERQKTWTQKIFKHSRKFQNPLHQNYKHVKTLSHLLDVEKDVTLPTVDGTTQVEHIIVSRYGIFVIETKKMKGWIFGSERQKTWTQKIFKHSRKFQNPLHQNYKHVKTLSHLLDVEENKFHSVIVFTGESTFNQTCRKTYQK